MQASAPRSVDLRLLPVAIGLWAAEAVVVVGAAAGWLGQTVAFLSVITAVGAVAIVVLRHRIRRSKRFPELAPMVIATALLGIGIGVALAGLRAQPVISEPLASMGSAHAVVHVVAEIAEPLRMSRRQPVSAPWSDSHGRATKRNWSARANLTEMTEGGTGSDGGTRWQLSVPVLLLGSTDEADLGNLIPGTVISAQASLRPGDPLRGTAAILRVRGSPEQLESAPSWQRVAAHVRSSMRSAAANLPPDARGLLPGLVVGDESGLSETLRSDMQSIGLSHLTAVSGANLAIVTGLVLALARLFGVTRRVAVCCAAAALFGFVVVVGPQPSVLRAAAMGVVGLFAIFSARDRAGFTALTMSIVALLMVDPWMSVSMGFALSVAATAGLLLFARAQRNREESHQSSRWGLSRAKRGLYLALGVACAAQLATLPLTASFGNGVPLVGVLANVLTEPAVPIATIFGCIAAASESIAPLAGTLPALVAGYAAQWIASVAQWSANLPYAVLPWPAGVLGFVLAAALSLVLVGLWIRRQQVTEVIRRHRKASTVIAAALLAVAVCIRGQPQWPPPNWLVVACDVGQGDALVLSTAPGHAVVVDVGPDGRQVDRCLSDLGVRSIDLLVLSHFHADHVDGLAGALAGRDVATAMVSPLAEPAQQFQYVQETLRARGVEPRIAAPGEQGTVGWLKYQVLWPTKVLRGKESAPNNASVAMAVEVGDPPVRILLTGDLEPTAQAALMSTNARATFDVVKVPHHGSRNQRAELSRWFSAAIAVVSVGANNRYGHPAASTIEGWQQSGATVLRTDQSGDIAVGREATKELFLVGRGPRSAKP